METVAENRARVARAMDGDLNGVWGSEPPAQRSSWRWRLIGALLAALAALIAQPWSWGGGTPLQQPPDRMTYAEFRRTALDDSLPIERRPWAQAALYSQVMQTIRLLHENAETDGRIGNEATQWLGYIRTEITK